MGDPGNFGSEALDVVLLPLQSILGNKQRKRAILDAHFLDLVIEPLLNHLPHEVRRGLENVSRSLVASG
jgi:hypothetical protein